MLFIVWLVSPGLGSRPTSPFRENGLWLCPLLSLCPLQTHSPFVGPKAGFAGPLKAKPDRHLISNCPEANLQGQKCFVVFKLLGHKKASQVTENVPAAEQRHLVPGRCHFEALLSFELISTYH